MEFEWDAAKHSRTLRERGIGFYDGARIFDGPVLIWEDARRDYGEERFRGCRRDRGRHPACRVRVARDRMRIISVRRANRKETELWRRRN